MRTAAAKPPKPLPMTTAVGLPAGPLAPDAGAPVVGVPPSTGTK